MFADAHISSLGYLWFNKFEPRPARLVFVQGAHALICQLQMEIK